jgi:hypothetical protein
MESVPIFTAEPRRPVEVTRNIRRGRRGFFAEML